MEEKKELSFEEKLDRLDEIVEEVESGSLPLEQSIKLYEEGMALIKGLETTLKEAEEKISKYRKPEEQK